MQRSIKQFAPSALEPARQFVLRSELDEDEEYVRKVLVRACKLLNHRFPEFDAWLNEEVPDEIYRRGCVPPNRPNNLDLVA